MNIFNNNFQMPFINLHDDSGVEMCRRRPICRLHSSILSQLSIERYNEWSVSVAASNCRRWPQTTPCDPLCVIDALNNADLSSPNLLDKWGQLSSRYELLIRSELTDDCRCERTISLQTGTRGTDLGTLSSDPRPGVDDTDNNGDLSCDLESWAEFLPSTDTDSSPDLLGKCGRRSSW
jgi:hypothetical protein